MPRRPITRCTSAAITIAARPSRCRCASRRKNSSSPGLRASSPVGRVARTQLPEIRPSGLRLAGIDAPRGGGRARTAGARTACVPPRLVERGRVFCRHALLAGRDDDHLRRAADGAGDRRRGVAGRVPRAVSGCVRARPRAPAAHTRSARAYARAGNLGRDRARAAVRVGRVSVGAARVQPGDRAPDRTARVGCRRLRPVGSRRGGVDSRCLRDRRTQQDRMARGGGCGGRGRPDRGVGRGAAPLLDVAQPRRARSRGRAAGQHCAGGEVESGEPRCHHRPLPLDDAAGARAGRHVHPVARIRDAAPVRTGHRRRVRDTPARGRVERHPAHRQRSDPEPIAVA